MNALVRAMEARGCRFVAPTAQDFSWMAPHYAKVHMLGEDLEFGLTEPAQRRPNPRPKPAKEDWRWKPHIYVPTGVLVLKVKSYSDGAQREWNDTKKRPIEDCLNEFMEGVVRAALYAQARRAHWAEQKRLAEEAARRQAEAERRARAEKASLEQLRAIVRGWRLALDAEVFFAEVEREAALLPSQERGVVTKRLENARQLLGTADDCARRLEAWQSPAERLGTLGDGDSEGDLEQECHGPNLMG